MYFHWLYDEIREELRDAQDYVADITEAKANGVKPTDEQKATMERLRTRALEIGAQMRQKPPIGQAWEPM